MRAEDKHKFLETMKMGYGNYNKKLPEDTLLKMWWKQLQYYDINLVKTSFDKWISENRFMFTVACVIASFGMFSCLSATLPGDKSARSKIGGTTPMNTILS